MTRNLPPPLSAAPSVETLETLFWGLQRPMRPGVPAPPPGPVLDVAALERDLAERVTTTWRVEHAPSGLPVHVAVGDRLTVEQLDRLRWHLGVEIPARATRFTAVPAEAPAPARPVTGAADDADAPLAWSAEHRRPHWVPLAALTTAVAALAVLLGSGVPLP